MINKKFGKLTVVSKATNIFCKNKEYGSWNCICECGNKKIAQTSRLNRGSIKSCGCLALESKSSLRVGDKVNKLILLEYLIGKWKCKCDCGNILTIPTDRINNGNTKSCGCLKTELLSLRSHKLIAGRRKFEPYIASARRVWKNYYYRDNECVNFEFFLKISQENCFYCGVKPTTEYNYFLPSSSKGAIKSKKEGLFIYNGLDRIDSLKNHTIDNIVACCYLCNKAKNNRSIDEFILYALSLNVNNKVSLNDEMIPELNLRKYYKTSVNIIYSTSYKDGDLTLKEFYYLSQKNCFYCNCKLNNNFNYARKNKKSSQKAVEQAEFIYNGLDRIDSSLPHNKDNVVPCCKYCNFAKGKLTFKEFQEWIIRIKSYQENNKGS